MARRQFSREFKLETVQLVSHEICAACEPRRGWERVASTSILHHGQLRRPTPARI